MTTYVCTRQAGSGFNGRDFAAITAEFQVDPTRRNECVELMRDVQMIFLRSGDNRWHLYENLTQPNKFRMEIVVPAGDGAWLKTNPNTVALALNLVPFAGIAFYGSSASCVTRLEGWHNQPYRVATCRIHGSQPITSTQLFRSVKRCGTQGQLGARRIPKLKTSDMSEITRQAVPYFFRKTCPKLVPP